MITTFLRISSILYRKLKKGAFQLKSWFDRIYYRIDSSKFAVEINHNGRVLMVVARYNENVDWCQHLEIPFIIYNKGKNDLPNGFPVVNLPNIGREGHTYLHYLTTNYHNLPTRIIFTQGDPFVHSPTFLNDVAKYDAHLPVQPLSIRYLPPFDPILKHMSNFETGIPSNNELNKCPYFFRDISFFVHKINGSFEAIWPKKFVDPVISNFKLITKYKSGSFSHICERINITKPEDCYFNYAAIFSVSNTKASKVPLDTYKKSMRFVLEDSEHGFLMERMWLTLFDFKAPS